MAARSLRLLDGRLEQSPIAHPGDAAELIELERVNLEHFLEVQELGRDHLASLASVFAWALTILAADARTRSFLSPRTGRSMSTSPSVVISRGVFSSIWSNSRTGRSRMTPKLFPMRLSFLTMVSLRSYEVITRVGGRVDSRPR